MINYANYVNTNTGTIGHLLSSTSPTVLQPHGMMQTVPVFAPGVVDKYTSDKIYGFMSGNDIVMPFCDNEGFDFNKMASLFDHDFETALPYYYSVLLEDYDITSEFSVLQHSGTMRLSFPSNSQNGILLYSLGNEEIKIDGNRIMTYSTSAIDKPFMVYEFSDEFSAETDEIVIPPIMHKIRNSNVKAIRIMFINSNVCFKYGMSYIDFDTAIENLNKEIEGFDFENVKSIACDGWNKKLSTIKVEGGSEVDKKIFYTAMYRSLSRMKCISEYGRYYSGVDDTVYSDEGHEYYVNDGMWDTYRCMHPLQLIIEEKQHSDIVQSYIRMFERSNELASFPGMYGDHPCMIGHHTTALFADTLVKGVSFDVNGAYKAVKKTLIEDSMLPWYNGAATELDKIYFEKGFFPALKPDEEETVPQVHSFEGRQSVAVALEGAYDDWCAAQIAKAEGQNEDYKYFTKRALNYQNSFDNRINFMAPKSADGEWISPYNPGLCGGQGGRKYFAENNAWIYTLHVQHDIAGLINLFGGREKLAEYLDQLFIQQYEVPKYYFLKQYPDATGLIGQYCQGNEPSFHIPYMFNYVGQPWKTQRKIHEIIRLWYHDGPLGICGDEDGGAMSSWLVFSAMGFYPLCPGTAVYDIGSPIFDEITITLSNGKELKIIADGSSKGKKYIQSATVNGKPLTKPWFTHDDIKAGATIELIMGERPNKKWGSQKEHAAPSLSVEK